MELKWKYKTNSWINSVPTINKDILYVGSNDMKLYAINALDGSLKWSFKCLDPVGWIYCSPLVNENKVYFGSRDHSLYALDIINGNIIWKYKASAYIMSSPSIKDEIIFFSDEDDFLYALDSKTGAEVWKVETDAAPGKVSLGLKGDILVANLDGPTALNISTGKKLWHTRDFKRYIDMAISDTSVVGLNGDDLSAVGLNSGIKIWGFRYAETPYFGFPVCTENIIYLATGDIVKKNGILYAINLHTGKEEWSLELNGIPVNAPVIYKQQFYYLAVQHQWT